MSDRENELIDTLRTSLFKGRAICESLSEAIMTEPVNDCSLADATVDYITQALTTLSDYEMAN